MKPLLAALALLPALAAAQAEPVRVSLDARGDDVREVLATLFAQAHRPYALDAAIKGRLYVSFDRMPFPKALNIVLTQADLVARDRDGVTMVSPAPKPPTPLPAEKKPNVAKPLGPPAPPTVVKRPAPEVPPAVFAHRVTTRLNRAPLADVLAVLGKQAGVEIALAPDVPAYRVDAFFDRTTLRYALDRLCHAAGLAYTNVDGAIQVGVRQERLPTPHAQRLKPF